MSSDLTTIAQQTSAPIVLRFPERSRANASAENSYKAIILFFPRRARASPTISQQRGSCPAGTAKWLIFKVRKLADNEWQVRARLGSRDDFVASFASERQALEWIESNQSDEWLKKRATRRRHA